MTQHREVRLPQRLVPSEVKRRSYERGKEYADFSTGAYIDVRDREKTQV